MNYYQHLLHAQDRQRDFTRERDRRLLAADVRLAKPALHVFRLHRLFRFSLPRRQSQPQQPPCITCPEYA